METLTLTADNQLYQSFFKGLVESFEQMKQSLKEQITNELRGDYDKKIRNLERSIANSRNTNMLRLINQLNDCKYHLEEYFDEEEKAMPISDTTYNNVLSVLTQCNDFSLNDWTIEPDTNGTVLLVSDNGDSVINIGESKYSFSMTLNAKETKQNAQNFDAKGIVELLNRYHYAMA